MKLLLPNGDVAKIRNGRWKSKNKVLAKHLNDLYPLSELGTTSSEGEFGATAANKAARALGGRAVIEDTSPIDPNVAY